MLVCVCIYVYRCVHHAYACYTYTCIYAYFWASVTKIVYIHIPPWSPAQSDAEQPLITAPSRQSAKLSILIAQIKFRDEWETHKFIQTARVSPSTSRDEFATPFQIHTSPCKESILQHLFCAMLHTLLAEFGTNSLLTREWLPGMHTRDKVYVYLRLLKAPGNDWISEKAYCACAPRTDESDP